MVGDGLTVAAGRASNVYDTLSPTHSHALAQTHHVYYTLSLFRAMSHT